MASNVKQVLHSTPPYLVPNWRNSLSPEEHGQLFNEDGVWNYSTMLLREDLGLLLLGARDAIYALDLDDISDKKASVRTPPR